MGELLQKDQEMSIVPQQFQNSNKGKITEIYDKGFDIELFHSAEGIIPNKTLEFYSQTKNGMLYFTSSVTKINGKILSIRTPLKHRFLQRRSFSRMKIIQDMEFKANDKTYKITTVDISASGMKLKTKEKLDINTEYNFILDLQILKLNPVFEPIRIEKNDEDTYTLSGRFKNLSNADKINLMQFCMRRNTENVNK